MCRLHAILLQNSWTCITWCSQHRLSQRELRQICSFLIGNFVVVPATDPGEPGGRLRLDFAQQMMSCLRCLTWTLLGRVMASLAGSNECLEGWPCGMEGGVMTRYVPSARHLRIVSHRYSKNTHCVASALPVLDRYSSVHYIPAFSSFV